LFAHAVRQDLIEKSPCEGLEAVELHGAPAARDRVLIDDELRLVWRAAEAAGYPFGPLVKLLLLTGQRRDEIADVRWSEIDGALLTIPAERMKGGFVQTVPLVLAAVEILDRLPRFAGGNYAFSTMGGKRPISGFSKMKARLDTAVAKLAAGGPIAPWTLHDLRRTVRTGLSSVGVLPVIAELTIGHKQTGISAIYDRHRYDDEKRTALDAWQNKLLAIVGQTPAPAGNVVDLPKRRRVRA
jgi:integrase